jgi:hypothetical protein
VITFVGQCVPWFAKTETAEAIINGVTGAVPKVKEGTLYKG